MNGRYVIGDMVMKNWRIRRKLGEGSFGKVYEIERKDFGETYYAALKVITVPQGEAELQAALEEMGREEAEAYFYGCVEDIVREFALMARVKGTAHVVSYEDHEVIPHEQGIGWDILIRMEELTPLSAYARLHPFARRDVIRLGIHMCQGLELCQKYNIIHRDLKPDNIFASGNGDFKLGDFGIARTVEKTMSGLSKKGTYNYMAPEVYKGQEYGFSVDIYSLGIVMYRLLNRNRLPFLPPAPQPLNYSSREQALARRMNGEALPVPCYGQGRLGEIILKAAAYAPGERYRDPRQMRRELEEVLERETDGTIIYPEEMISQEGESLAQEAWRSRDPGTAGDVQPGGNRSGMGDGRMEELQSVPTEGRGDRQGAPVEEETTEKIADPAEDKTISIFGDGASNQTKVCANCGSPMQGDESFCTVCGASASAQDTLEEPQKKSSRGKKGILAVLLLLVAVMAGGTLFYILWKGNRQDPGQMMAETVTPSPSPSPTQTPAPSPTGQPGDSPEPSAPEDSVIAVPSIENRVLSIDAITGNPLAVENAVFLPFGGSLSGEGQEDLYTFEAPYDGTYRVDVNGMPGAMEVNLYAYDASGAGITTQSRCSNGQGMTVSGLSAGNTYQIKVKQRAEYGSYTMTVGLQKESLDVTEYTQLADNVEFEDQSNLYLFTAPRDGRYRFELSEMMGNVTADIFVYNHLGELVVSERNCFNGRGVTVYEMTAGETYQIQVCQKEGYSSYILSLGQQKETVDISDYTIIKDSVEFTEQKNVYLCTVPLDGRYRLELSDMMGGTEVELHVYNELKELVDSVKNCSNGQGLTLKGLTAGETYWVQVRQKNGFSDYTLTIGPQKVTVPVEKGNAVTDSVEYTDQRNVYSFTAEQDGDVTFTLSEMMAGTMVELYVFNDLGEEVVSQKQCYNGGNVSVQGVTKGTFLEVQVRQKEGLGSYRMEIE